MSDKDILTDAREQFREIQEAESKNRKSWVDDVRFALLGEQWPPAIKRQRELDGRPCLTINRLPSFVRQVTNDARMNRPAIMCHPVADGANKATAEILNGLIRNIEYTSNAEVAYDTALEHAVAGGYGYFRIATKYAHDDTFDQDLCIERIENPMSVYGDKNATGADSSEWNVAFITDLWPDKQFKAKYGKDAQPSDWESDSHDKQSQWFQEGYVRVAEYWTRDETPSTLLKLSSGIVIRKEDYLKGKDIFDVAGITVEGERPTKTMKVTQRIITGAEVLETNAWAGRYIPIVPVYGSEVIVEGEKTYVSLIRGSKDAQQMFNYWRTASTELVALAPKAPFIGPRGFANSSPEKWGTANSVNHAYLEYDGNTPPQRQGFDGPPAGALQEAANATDDMKSIMGIYDASLGARSNETSGKAIMARQREGDTSTFNFIDNLSRAIRHAGRILVDMIPHVYNTERIIRVIHEDGDNDSVPINQPIPAQPQQPGQPPQPPSDAQQDAQEFQQGMMRIYDLTTGKYDVTCDAGPSYTTKRQEASEQMMQFMQAYPAAGPLIGDLLAKNLDWPGADDIADRLKLMLPPQIQGQNPQVQQMQQQLQQMQQQLQQGGQAFQALQEELKRTKGDLAVKMREAEIKAFSAETDRIQATSAAMTPEQVQALVMQTLQQALSAPPIGAQ